MLVLFQAVGAKTYLQYIFEVNETCHTETATGVVLMSKVECSSDTFPFK